MALNGRKVWGAWANRCRACSKEYVALRSTSAYCSPACGRQGRLRHQRVWAKARYMARRMDPLRLSERLEAVLRLPAIGLTPQLTRFNHAKRMMAYA